MEKKIAVVLLVFVLGNCFGQKKVQSFNKLSKAEKYWVTTHVFKAKKAHKVAHKVLRVVDSLKKVGTLGTHVNGNHLDAFKHALWMWETADEIGLKSARKLGEAHEKGNYEFFLSHKNEDGFVPDKESGLMDTYNNRVGLMLHKSHRKQPLTLLEKSNVLVTLVNGGLMKVLLQGPSGIFYNCKNEPILPKLFELEWESGKCLVPSFRKVL